MPINLEILRSANQQILDGLAAQDEELAAREKALTDELDKIIGRRQKLKDDREILMQAGEIQARILMSTTAPAEPIQPAANDSVALEPVQTRARIGPQRYFMLTALRKHGPLTTHEIATATGLNLARVREQMKSDAPVYVRQGPLDDGANPRMVLTPAGLELLSRFEGYRKSQGKPLPTLGGSDDDEDETNEPVDAQSVGDTSTGSDPTPAQGREAGPGGGT